MSILTEIFIYLVERAPTSSSIVNHRARGVETLRPLKECCGRGWRTINKKAIYFVFQKAMIFVSKLHKK